MTPEEESLQINDNKVKNKEGYVFVPDERLLHLTK